MEELKEIKDMLIAVLASTQMTNAKLDALSADFYQFRDETNSRLARLEADMQVLKHDVQVLKDDVQVLKRDVQVLKDDVHVLKHDVQVLKDDVHVLKHDVQVVKVDMADVKGYVRYVVQKVTQHDKDLFLLKPNNIMI